MRGFTISRAQALGLYYDDSCDLELQDMTFIDNSVSMAAFVALPNVLEHQYKDKYVHIADSLFVGQSPWLDCRVDIVDVRSEHFLQTSKCI